jgi:hypothetical protein
VRDVIIFAGLTFRACVGALSLFCRRTRSSSRSC